ncbi:MAG: ABC transporter ATP-binding protein [bacterium]|nr:ABC transporter ATP-binding protein [bacterium]
MERPLLELSAVDKSFGQGEARLEVLKSIDLKLESGEMVALLGFSGAGKSTMLHVMGGLDRPTSGKVIFEGSDIYEMNMTELSMFRNRDLGFVFQAHHLLPEFTALENVMMPALIAKVSKEEAREKALDLLSRVGLSKRGHHKSGELSGGEQQRVAVARAMVMHPKLLLADEPTGNLDTKTGDDVFEIIMELNKYIGTTFVMVTHNEMLASKTGRQIFVQDGRLAS